MYRSSTFLVETLGTSHRSWIFCACWGFIGKQLSSISWLTVVSRCPGQRDSLGESVGLNGILLFRSGFLRVDQQAVYLSHLSTVHYERLLPFPSDSKPGLQQLDVAVRSVMLFWLRSNRRLFIVSAINS